MTMFRSLRPGIAAMLVTAFALASTAHAQDRGAVNPKPLPPLANPDDPDTPAKALFGPPV